MVQAHRHGHYAQLNVKQTLNRRALSPPAPTLVWGRVQARREPQPHGSQEQRHTTVAAVAAPHRQDERQAEESAEEAEAAAAASKTRRKGEALEEGDAVAATPLTATQEAREMTQAPTVDAEPAQGEAAAGAATSANGSVSPAASVDDATCSGPRVLLVEGSDRIGGRGGHGRRGSA
ncbi:unnamed protein product [Closterium sp. NIES-65]|nr:unnamed protein product [Closterium sp. NIES-65]